MKIIGFYRKCDFVTILSIIFSFLGILLAFNNHIALATILLIFCGLCDVFDGKIARMKEYSNEQKIYGVQLDSLTDLLSFGIFPAIITICVSNFNIWTIIIGLFYVICGLIRLAYFNMLEATEEKMPNTFIGLPITTIAIVYPLIYIIFQIINSELLKIILPITLITLGILFILKIKVPKPNVVAILNKILNKYVVYFIFLPLSIMFIIDIFYKLNFKLDIFGSVARVFLQNISSYIIIYIIITTFIFLSICLFKNSKRSLIFIFSILIIFLIINDIKYRIIGIPIEISDIYYLNPDNIKMMGESTGSIGSWIYITLLKALIVALIGFIFFLLDKYHPINIKTFKNRIILFIVLLATIILEFLLIVKNSNLILQKIYKLNNNDIIYIENNSTMYYDYGFTSGMLLDFISKHNITLEGYSKKDTENLLNSFDSIQNDKSWGKANVVIMLSEAFSDITNLSDLEFNTDLMPNIHRFENLENAMVMDLLVPAYGGTSVNSEFEILTGASLTFWKAGFIPYTQYYNNLNGIKAPNIMKEFANNGYDTSYITPWGQESYKSSYVYGLFSANHKKYGNDINCYGANCTDKMLADILFEELKDTSAGNYKFIMSASGENHFPWAYDDAINYDIDVKSEHYTKNELNIIKDYAQGIYDADAALNYLYEKIQTLSTPTILVFFGDHLPYLIDDNGDQIYLSSSYLNTPDTNINTLRQYTTKAVIIANYDIKTENIPYLKASYLGSYVLNKLDLNISNYFKFIDYTRSKLPVFNRHIIYDTKTDQVKLIEEATEEEKDIWNNYQYVQHYSFYDL